MAGIEGLISRLARLVEEPVQKEYSLLVNSKSEAQNLSSNLKKIQLVLAEAGTRRLTDARVRDWIQRLDDVKYEIGDAMDEWEIVNFQTQIQEFGGDDDDVLRIWLNKVSIFIESVCLSFQRIHKQRDIAKNIKRLNAKVELLAKESVNYSTLLPINNDSPDVKPQITTSYSQLVALNDQEHIKEKIKELLIGEDLVGNVPVISLVGMAGIGKTTLAQLAFHDDKVQSSFVLRSWICLSHASDEVGVTKAILQSFDVSYPEDADLQKLLNLMHSFVSGKKLLLVLDNVWIEDDSFWRQLKGSLIYGKALQSRILVTSRNENVAKSMGSTRIIRVECLSDSDCCLLFKEIAFCGWPVDKRRNLEVIGQRIANKCEGLPLAAKTLGCYLRSRYSIKLWKGVLEKEFWQLEQVAEPLFAPFAFSYDELPVALKRCFSCCGILPKGGSIKVDKLISIWMMLGYVISLDPYVDIELIGMDYLEKLVSRFLLQNVGKDHKSCEIHSIVHGFAQYLTKTEGSKAEELRNSLINVDGLSGDQFGSLKCVRVLSVGGGKNQELPSEIGNLIHLRYLRVTTVKKLSLSICGLYHLHTLNLRQCQELSELPKEIHMLRNLRHLLLEGTTSLKRVPAGVGKLTDLLTLDEFKVGRGRSELRYLENLNQLQGTMCIYVGELNEEENVNDAGNAKLGNKRYISRLEMAFDKEEVRMDVLEALQVPPNLQYLSLHGYIGTQFPRWISTTFLNKLKELELSFCEKCFHLPALGTLPFLEELSIWYLTSLKSVGSEFLVINSEGNNSSLPSPLFPNLRRLYFRGCRSWKKWEDITENEASSNTLSIMPFLQTLIIRKCNRLKTLPYFLRSSIYLDTDHKDLENQWEERGMRFPQLVHE